MRKLLSDWFAGCKTPTLRGRFQIKAFLKEMRGKEFRLARLFMLLMGQPTRLPVRRLSLDLGVHVRSPASLNAAGMAQTSLRQSRRP